MMPTRLDEPSVRRYLLGTLPEAEAIALEERYFADPEAFEQVWAIENELVDDHAAGRLAPAERRSFEEHYLASPRHRERAAMAQALRRAASPPASRSARSAWAPLALAASLLAALAAVWLLRHRPPESRLAEAPPPLSSPRATAEPSPTLTPGAQPPAAVPVVVAFAVSPILVRGSGEQPRLRLPALADEVLLQLEGEPVPARRLTFTLRTVEGASVASGRAHPPAPGRPGQAATVRLPVAQLPPGDYVLALSAAGADEPAQQYYFRILAP